MGSYKNALFINIIVINTVIGIVQEIRAKLTVEKISLVTEPKATVIRDGKTQDIPVDHIVLDEHICLKTGKQIPSDGVVLLGDLEINEALLTGEADPILKKVGDPVLSGSFVVAGTGEIKVTRVGADNYANQLASEVKRINKPHSDIMNALGSITKFVSIIILPVGLLLLGQAIAIQGRSLQMGVTSTVAALVGRGRPGGHDSRGPGSPDQRGPGHGRGAPKPLSNPSPRAVLHRDLGTGGYPVPG